MRMVLNLDRTHPIRIMRLTSSFAVIVVSLTAAPAGLSAQTAAPGPRGDVPPVRTAGQGNTVADAGRLSPTASVSVERIAYLMGTRAVVSVEAAQRESAIRASEAALDAMSGMEDLLSTWRDDTELARLNRAAPGRSVQPDAPLAQLLREVGQWVHQTGGAFHPAVGSLIDAWDLRGDGRVPSPEELRRARGAAGDAGVLLDPSSGAVMRRDTDAWLDAGAFGKGAALREARHALSAAGVPSARIDLGGQILAFGEAPLTVSVAHPVHRRQPLHELTVADASVATSGQSERGIEVHGVRYGHLLDPRSGRPVPAWGSVTVVHADPVAADILATALFVLGPDDGIALAESLDDVAALFLVTEHGGVTERMTPAMRQYLSLRSTEEPFSGSRDPHQP